MKYIWSVQTETSVFIYLQSGDLTADLIWTDADIKMAFTAFQGRSETSKSISFPTVIPEQVYRERFVGFQHAGAGGAVIWKLIKRAN